MRNNKRLFLISFFIMIFIYFFLKHKIIVSIFLWAIYMWTTMKKKKKKITTKPKNKNLIYYHNKKKSSHSSLSLEGLCLRKNLWLCYSYTELKILFRKQMFLNSQPFNVYGFSFKRSVLTVTSLYVLNSCCWIIILYDLLIFYWLSLANPFLVWAAKRKLKISNFPIVTDDIHNSLVAPLQLISFYDNRQQILLAWYF